MDLITTHINADFDGLGSLVAARKLYPDSRLMLPGSQEASVRELISLVKESVPVESEKECRLDDVTRLILVDTRHKSRIGSAAELIDRGVEVHIYDHHPGMKGDIVADKDVSEEVGATVTILADMIKKKGIKLSPLEATIMLVGIYEETGSLTYRATTKLDVDMVSFLLSQGASISVVSNYLNRQLSENELSLLAKLISLTHQEVIKGVSVSFIEIESSEHAGELGMLIHKLMDIENIPVLFVLVDTARSRIDIIARSKITGIDVNKILSHFGGGGHPGAASAKARGMSLAQAKARLIKALKEHIKISSYAGDIMSKDVFTIDVNGRIDEAKNLLLKYKLSGIPVVDGAGLVGVITMEQINKAVKNGFSHARVKGYMARNMPVARPDEPLHSLQKALSDTDLGVLPVVKGNRLVGVINRVDILRSIHSSLFTKPQGPKKTVVSNLANKMSKLLDSEIMSLLCRVGSLADSLGSTAFVVGGLVRDIMLGVPNFDLDIVIEGDAIKLGQALAKKLKGSGLVVHKKFGTCSVITKGRLKIDLATARKETYERPAALPTVEFSSLANDLVRRDFTINAMAVSINKNSFGRLIDFFGGEDDLARGRIRVMHDASFIDDPTRIFRAVRFETRFGFRIDQHTEHLIRTAISKEMFDKVQPQRIRDELILILKEAKAFEALKRMAELDELRFLHHNIRMDNRMERLFLSVDGICAWYEESDFKKRPLETYLIYLMALLGDLSYKDTLYICDRFVFKRGDGIRILSHKKLGRGIIKNLRLSDSETPSRIYSLLEPLSYEVIILITAEANSKRAFSRVKDFFERHNGVKVKIRGGDLKRLGLKPCAAYKDILRRVLYARLDGKVNTKPDEIAFAKRLIAKRCT